MRTIKAVSLMLSAATAALLLFGAVPAQAGASQRSKLYWNTPDRMGEVVSGSSVRVDRTASWASFRVQTGGLKPGHAYTLWVVAFNSPEGCHGNPGGADGACGLPDAFSPLSGASHHRVDGAVIPSSGAVVFSSQIQKGEPGELEGEPGLQDPQGAEYMIVVRDHGPAVKGSDQTTSLNGGCLVGAPPGEGSQGTYMCENEQTAKFGTP